MPYATPVEHRAFCPHNAHRLIDSTMVSSLIPSSTWKKATVDTRLVTDDSEVNAR